MQWVRGFLVVAEYFCSKGMLWDFLASYRQGFLTSYEPNFVTPLHACEAGNPSWGVAWDVLSHLASHATPQDGLRAIGPGITVSKSRHK